MSPDEAEARFRSLVADPTAEPPLDEGALLIAAVATGADPDSWLSRLDELTGRAFRAMQEPTPDEVARVLFVEWGLAGNVRDYGDPRNSYLPDVMERRLGIPISLSVLMIEVGRRLGIGLHGVGMPGHFLVGVDDDPHRFVDPYHAGAILDRDACAARFRALNGGEFPFHPSYLAPTGTRAILLRMLANLEQSFVDRRLADARWAAELRLAFPELPDPQRRRSAEVLASVGAYDRAATVLESLAAELAPDRREELEVAARRHRARSN